MKKQIDEITKIKLQLLFLFNMWEELRKREKLSGKFSKDEVKGFRKLEKIIEKDEKKSWKELITKKEIEDLIKRASLKILLNQHLEKEIKKLEKKKSQVWQQKD